MRGDSTPSVICLRAGLAPAGDGREAYGPGARSAGVDRSPLVIGLAGVFGGMTLLLVVLAAVFGDPVVALMTVPFAAATYVFWYHASGRIRSGLRERVRRERPGRVADGRREQGGFGAGPRFGREARTRAGREARADGRSRRRAPGPGSDSGGPAGEAPSRREAYRALGLEEGADDAAVRRAYREKVKAVHPDRGGDEVEFKRVTRAYERLTE